MKKTRSRGKEEASPRRRPGATAPVQNSPLPAPQDTRPKTLFAANPMLWSGLVFVAAIFFVGFSLFIIKLLDTIDEQNQRLVTAQHLAQLLQVRLVGLEEDARQTSGIVQVISSPKLRMLVLRATDLHPWGFGKILWDPERNGALLQAGGLPAASAGMTYQLWREGRGYGGRPPACVFPSTGAGVVPLSPAALAGVSASASFKLTMDKEGATSPSTDVYLESGL